MKRALARSLAKHGARPLRFALVGVVNTGLDVGIFALLFLRIRLGVAARQRGVVHHRGRQQLCDEQGLDLQRHEPGARGGGGAGWPSLAVAVIGLALASATIWLAALAMPAIFAKLAAVGVSFAWNYWASARFVFR